MLRALVVADEVAPDLSERTLRELAPDLLLGAGDLPWDYLEWVHGVVDCPAAFVPGNHDPSTARISREVGLAWADLAGEPPGPRGVVNVDRAVVTVGGLRVAGLGGCVRYRRGPHQYSQRELARAGRRLVRAARGAPVDVLLTHAPPYGLGDGSDDCHVGVQALHDVLARLQPTWHLHGHIHPFGIDQPDRQVGPTTIRNVIPWQLVEVDPRDSVGLATKATPRFTWM